MVRIGTVKVAGWRPWQLGKDLKNWRKNKIWFRPTATKPTVDELGNNSQTFMIKIIPMNIKAKTVFFSLTSVDYPL